MKILGIDTSTLVGSIGLIDGQKIIAEQTLDISRQHSSRLMPAIDQVLTWSNLNIREIDAVAVAVGPGSFTGVRIAVSTAKTICYTIKKPIIGISTLESIAYNLAYTPSQICVILDARRNQVYSAIFKKRDRQSPDRCQALSELLPQIQPPVIFAGSGLEQYADQIKTYFNLEPADSVCLANLSFGIPRGINVAQLGLGKLMTSYSDDLFTISPNYIRAGVAPS